MSDLKSIPLGSVWQEVDPRFTRMVLVVAVGIAEESATPRSLNHAPICAGKVTLVPVSTETLQPIPGRRASFAKPERFNGKRGGYAPRVQS